MNLFRAISNLLRFDRTNWKVLALCFFAAAIFWIFNALNKDYSTNVRFPLLFEFDQNKYIAVEPLPPVIMLNVSGNGWELFRKGMGLKIPRIALPLERPVETRKIVASSLSPQVASQIGALQMNYIVTDTLRLKIEPRVSKKIKLSADLSALSFKEGYGRISPITILPDSILLEGPKSFLAEFKNELPVKISASRIKSAFRESIEVSIPNGELIRRNPPVAEVIFEVGPVEETVQWIKMKVPKLPWGVEISRDSARCVFLIPQKDYEHFLSDINLATASIEAVELKKGESKLLLPVITAIPPYATLLHTDSVTIKRY